MNAIVTKGKIKRDKRDAAIKTEYLTLIGNPENMKSAIIDDLSKKHKASITTVYRAIK